MATGKKNNKPHQVPEVLINSEKLNELLKKQKESESKEQQSEHSVN